MSQTARRGTPVTVTPGDRVAFWMVAMAFTVTMLGTTLPTPLYAIYQQRLGFSTGVTTVVFAVYAAGVIAALVLLGRASDTLGRRPLLLAGLGCAALSAVVFLRADDLTLLLVGRALSGLSAGIFTGTATATLVDLADHGRSKHAATVATVANMGGLGLGPILAGLLAQFSAAPVHLPYAVHLALLGPAAVAVLLMPEPVAVTGRRPPLPRLGVPGPVRPTFARAATVGFAGFAVLGLFAAASPGFLRQLIGPPDPVVAGAVASLVFVASALGQVTLVRPLGRAGLPAGSAALLVGMLLLAAGLAAGSLALLLAAGVIAGLGQGVSFQAGLAILNAAAPPRQRAEVASTFFLVMYLAISVPVVGLGLAADALGLRTGGIAFALGVAALVLIALMADATSTRQASRTTAEHEDDT